MKVMFVYGAFENLGIEYLSAVLKQHGHETRLAFDPQLFSDPFMRIPDLSEWFNYEPMLVDEILAYEPEVLVFSVISAQYEWAVRIATAVKMRSSRIHITFGGIHPTSVPEQVIAMACVDTVIVGEGEYALLELVDSVAAGGGRSDIRNVWFKQGRDIIQNQLRPYMHDLDALPFPDKELYYRVLPFYRKGYTVITRRGCSNSCSYCHNTIWQGLYPFQARVRMRSVENVIAELREAKERYRYERIRINDDMFTYDEDWLKDFAKEFKRYIDVPTYCFGQPMTLNENVMRYLQDIRCYQLCLGVQSVDARLREDVLGRHEENESIGTAIQLCRAYKIRCVVDNIIGVPGEKNDVLLDMARFYAELRPDRVCVFGLIYFPKTPIIAVARERGILSPDEVSRIEKSPSISANTVVASQSSKEHNRYRWLLFLIPLLPKRFLLWVIKNKVYSILPSFSPAHVEAFVSMFAKDRLDIPRQRYYKRYMVYGFRCIKQYLVKCRNRI